VVPNLTPDPETGTGTWSDETLARAIREGVGHDGRALFPLMPFQKFRALSADISNPVKRGAYLAAIAACTECHTPQQRGEPIAGLPFAPVADGFEEEVGVIVRNARRIRREGWPMRPGPSNTKPLPPLPLLFFCWEGTLALAGTGHRAFQELFKHSRIPLMEIRPFSPSPYVVSPASLSP
jgi:hypothetical protein